MMRASTAMLTLMPALAPVLRLDEEGENVEEGGV
jgi:hypothetical protein